MPIRDWLLENRADQALVVGNNTVQRLVVGETMLIRDWLLGSNGH